MPPLIGKPKEFDFSSFVPDFIESPAREAWNSLPEPVKSVGRFGFETFIPSDPTEQIAASLNPFGTALNVPRKTLKYLSEELIDTLDNYVYEKGKRNVIKDILSKHPSTGYLGGEGNIVTPSISDVADEILNVPGKLTPSLASYRTAFTDRQSKKDFSEFARSFGENPLEIKDELSRQRGRAPAIAINEPILTETGIKSSLEHEMRHLGQDVAPGGILEKTPPLEQKYIKFLKKRGEPAHRLPHSMRPQELLISAHRTTNPELAGKPIFQRLDSAFKAKYLQPYLNQNPDQAEFFYRHILPMLTSHGR